MSLSTELESVGFAVERSAIRPEGLARLLELCVANSEAITVRHRSGEPFAVRGLLWSCPELARALLDLGPTALATSVLGKPAFPVDATFFDKQARANWTVPAHQDRVLPVSDASLDAHHRHGLSYAEPRAEILAQLLAIRIHFDACDADSGALSLAPASHHRGVIADEQIASFSLAEFRVCAAASGDLLLMRPLVLHRSSPTQAVGQRRVLHVVYATEQPGSGLTWRETLG